MASPQNQKAGQYYLLEKIAQGGMAEIFKGLAYDLAGIQRTVCIKKILPHIAASREFIDMLVDEAKIAVKLSQGNIAQIYDLGKAGDDYFMVMEYVDGQTLSRIHRKCLKQARKIPIPLVCTIISEIASGLNYMHRKTDEAGHPLNIIHRDISPQNIMVSYSGTVKIIDFGIAKAAVKIGHTESGILKGKFAYMSPEQAEGDNLDHRSDIFSLGVIFHELLTGKRLFKASENKETLKNVKRSKVAPPSQIIPEIPPELDAIVLKALSKDRRHRFAFASDFHEAILKFLHTQYPDFRPAHLAEFIRDLFREEFALQQTRRETEKETPQIFLEPTAGRTPETELTQGGQEGAVNWREFMLEEDLPKEAEKLKPEIKDRMEEESESSEGENTDKKWFPRFTFKKEILFWSLGIAAAALLGFFVWQFQGGRSPMPPADAQKKPAAEGNVPSSPPLPPKIILESNPSGAKIYLNDRDTGLVTPTTLENLPPGSKHQLGIFLPNYKFFRTPFEAKPNETQRFHVELILDYGSLKITSTPSGATVRLDGKLLGNTPLLKEGLKPGSQSTVEIQMEGFLPYKEEFVVNPGKESRIHGKLERAPPASP